MQRSLLTYCILTLFTCTRYWIKFMISCLQFHQYLLHNIYSSLQWKAWFAPDDWKCISSTPRISDIMLSFSSDGTSYAYLHVGSFREIFQLYDLWYTVWPLISLPCSAYNSYTYLGSFCFCDVLHMLCIGGQYMLFLLFLSPLRRRSLTNYLILMACHCIVNQAS